MGKFNNIKMVNKYGLVKEYDVLATFDYKSRKFIIYTDYSMDETNKIKIYSGIYGEKEKVFPVTNSEDEIVTSNFIKFLEKGLKENTLFV